MLGYPTYSITMTFWNLEWVKIFGLDCKAWGGTGIFMVFNADITARVFHAGTEWFDLSRWAATGSPTSGSMRCYRRADGWARYANSRFQGAGRFRLPSVSFFA